MQPENDTLTPSENDTAKQDRSYLPIILASIPLAVGAILVLIRPQYMMEYIKPGNLICGGAAILAILFLSGLAYVITSMGSILISRNKNSTGRVLLKVGLVILVLLFFISPAVWFVLATPAAIRMMNSGYGGL